MNALESQLTLAKPSHHKSAHTGPASARPAWGYAAWGALLGMGVALLIWAPARWLAWGVAQASQGQVQWLDPRGSVWAGSAQLALSGGTGSRDPQALPGRLHWTLKPAWTGLQLGWLADCCMAQAANLQVHAGWSTWQVQSSDHSSQWPAALLTGLGAPWNTLQPDGQLQLQTRSLQLQWAQGRMQMKGLAELHVQNLSSRLSPIKPIGSYQLQLRGTPEGTPTPSLQLSTQQGPLLISGEGQWVGARLRFTGEARAQEGHEPALNNLLNILGRRQGTRSLIFLG
ncbi:general secretion pathway protein GspN [Limnohabitans sp. 2KL-17]|uniref:type II secretion system protein N n=1 Tax=Limnohabitans sp. 2KL-17 TaxID=1100704 RepID=UPI000DD2351B|nr:type II secretion system protein N [Limnohabitans sp. 2KL-17]PUE53629.1 general secretion pathway protein GspN [Limnohabitans sp. 2KL-17]